MFNTLYKHPRGGARNKHDGEVRSIFWVENLQPWYFLGSRDLLGFLGGLQISK